MATKIYFLCESLVTLLAMGWFLPYCELFDVDHEFYYGEKLITLAELILFTMSLTCYICCMSYLMSQKKLFSYKDLSQ